MNDIAARPLLLADRGCPFAQRVRALFTHLDVAYDAVESNPGDHPIGLATWSPSRRVPVLVHGGISIGESRVMLEHIAEAWGFADAYPSDLPHRSLHREIMAIVDEQIAPALPRDRTLRPARLGEYLDRLEQVAHRTLPEPCLLAFHLAPIWLRFQWWRPASEITRAIRERPRLVTWLDSLTELPAIVATSPNRADTVADFEAACALPASP